ncbi:GrpB family protein [Dyadobacter sp. CY312]|uniref:GrpB family protein n=1 Tax=Dyadobacter sp. CY312 TaxID=2907303 RepID=UPI001F36B7DE|nr:GrpB family protein [Dyadobacter sp. CY312]MCE7043153.1 GrpB family protein [Dyadobacter sp. CY312]
MISIVPYQAHVPSQFREIAGSLHEATKARDISICHIGSTAEIWVASINWSPSHTDL